MSIEQADESVSLQQFQPVAEEKLALVFGNEVKGVLESVIQQSDQVVEIPQFGTKHSFGAGNHH